MPKEVWVAAVDIESSEGSFKAGEVIPDGIPHHCLTYWKQAGLIKPQGT